MLNHHPEKFYQISRTQMSIARHYGGINYNGKMYVYNPVDDTLTREDIWKAEHKKKTKEKKKEKGLFEVEKVEEAEGVEK